MKFKKLMALCVFGFLAISCANNEWYYSRHPLQAKSILRHCKNSDYELSKKDKENCQDAKNGLFTYTYKKNRYLSYDQIIAKIKDTKDEEYVVYSALERLKNEKIDDKKRELDKKANLYYINNIKNKTLKQIEKEAREDSYKLCKLDSSLEFNPDCYYAKRLQDKIAENLEDIFKKEFDNMSYYELFDYSKIKENNATFFTDFEKLLQLSKKMYIEKLLLEKKELEKQKAYQKGLIEFSIQSIEDLENLTDLVEYRYTKNLDAMVCKYKNGVEYSDGRCEIRARYIDALNETLLNKKKEYFTKKYEDYSYEKLIERFEELEKKRVDCNTKDGKKVCDKSKFETEYVYTKIMDMLEKQIDDNYNKLVKEYEYEDPSEYLNDFPDILEYKVFADYKAMKMGQVSKNIKKYRFDGRAKAAVKLYIEKRDKTLDMLSKLKANDLYNEYIDSVYKKIPFSAYDVYQEEFKRRNTPDIIEKTKEELKNLSLIKLYEMAKKLPTNSWMIDTITQKLLDESNSYNAERTYGYYKEKCEIAKNKEAVAISCKKLKETLNKKNEIEVREYLKNFKLLKSVANECILNAKQSKGCNVNKYPYKLISEALKRLKKYSIDQINLKKEALYIK